MPPNIPSRNEELPGASSAVESHAGANKLRRQISLKSYREHSDLQGSNTGYQRKKTFSNDGDQMAGKKSLQSEELVKYMSNVPDYLQRPGTGDSFQEKALSFGVLDWDRLEKWKCQRKSSPMTRRVENSISLATVDKGKGIVSSRRMIKSASFEKKITLPEDDRPLHKYVKRLHPHSYVENRQRNELEQCGVHIINSTAVNSVEKSLEVKSVSTISNAHVNECRSEAKIGHRDGESHIRMQLLEKHGSHSLGDGDAWVDNCRYSRGGALVHGSWVDIQYPKTGHGRFVAATNSSTGKSDMQFTAVASDVHSFPFPCELQDTTRSDIDFSIPANSRVAEGLSNEGHPLQNSGEKMDIRSIHETSHRNKFSTPVKQSVAQPSQGTPEMQQDANLKILNTRIISYDTTVQKLNSAFRSVRIGSIPDDSVIEKLTPRASSRRSPLSRMIYQVLKPKPVDAINESLFSSCRSRSNREYLLQDHPVAKRGSGNSFSSNSDTSTGQPVKWKLNLSGPLQDDKHGLNSVNAFVQVAYKDGLPFLTFTFNTPFDNLAASLKRMHVLENDCEWMYTFYTLQKAHKKGFLWKQGKEGKTCTGNVVGRLKVSMPYFPESVENESKGSEAVIQYVLFGAGLNEAPHEALNFLSANELAAVVVSSTKLRAPDITVIIPSGIHGLPSSTGVPSSLVDRWRSGGLCDCGGWDVGCTLMILKNHDPPNSGSFQACDSGASCQLELFNQGGPQERCALRLVAFTSELYSVQFRTSISPLQAFSVCVAFLHGHLSQNQLQVHCLREAETPQKNLVARTRINASTKIMEVPPNYFPCPPCSPVGRI